MGRGLEKWFSRRARRLRDEKFKVSKIKTGTPRGE
jgi:hypothetical protein